MLTLTHSYHEVGNLKVKLFVKQECCPESLCLKYNSFHNSDLKFNVDCPGVVTELSSVVLFYAVSCCLDQLLNIKQTKPKPDHTLFGFAPHQKQTSVCQSALDRDAVDLEGTSAHYTHNTHLFLRYVLLMW